MQDTKYRTIYASKIGNKRQFVKLRSRLAVLSFWRVAAAKEPAAPTLLSATIFCSYLTKRIFAAISRARFHSLLKSSMWNDAFTRQKRYDEVYLPWNTMREGLAVLPRSTKGLTPGHLTGGTPSHVNLQ